MRLVSPPARANVQEVRARECIATGAGRASREPSMRPRRPLVLPGIHLGVLVFALLSASGAAAAEPTGTAVEFYNARLNHYFTTADAAEAAMLDAGVIVPGWARTGVEFSVWARASDDPAAVP